MKLNDEIRLKISDDNHNGNGISLSESIPVFINGGLKDDDVLVRITKVNKKYAEGKILSFYNRAIREDIKCPYYDRCGGCDLLHISSDKELSLKGEYLERLFGKSIKINSYNDINYRNKIVLHVSNNILGLYKKGSNEIVKINNCLLVDDSINEIIGLFNNFDLSNITEVVIKKGDKLLINILGTITNKDLMALINTKIIGSIYQNELLIYGDKYITHFIDKFKYFDNNDSFFQVNEECMKELYSKVKKYVGESNKLLDLYCGSATIGIFLSDICKSVIGVEINKDSYLYALKNIEENKIKNYKIINDDASAVIGDFDTIVVDPPRSGLSKKVIDNIQEMNPKKLIYISCNPSTLKRDIGLLNNYKLVNVEGFNMFPRTKHIETLCVLERI